MYNPLHNQPKFLGSDHMLRQSFHSLIDLFIDKELLKLIEFPLSYNFVHQNKKSNINLPTSVGKTVQLILLQITDSKRYQNDLKTELPTFQR